MVDFDTLSREEASGRVTEHTVSKLRGLNSITEVREARERDDILDVTVLDTGIVERVLALLDEVCLKFAKYD